MENQTAANRNRGRGDNFFSRGRRRPAIAATALIVLFAGIWVAVKSGERADLELRLKLVSRVTDVAAAFNTLDIRKLAFTADSKEQVRFQRICAQLRAYAEVSEPGRLYIIGLRDGQIVSGPESLIGSPQPGTVCENPDQQNFDVFEKGQPQVWDSFKGKNKTHMTALAPIADPYTGEVLAAVGMEAEASVGQAAARQAQWIPVGVTVALLVVLLLIDLALDYLRGPSGQRAGQKRYAEPVLCAVFMFLLTLVLTAYFVQMERAERRRIFDSLAHHEANAIAGKIYDRRSMLQQLAYYFESEEEGVTREEFRAYCDAMGLKNLVDSVVWIPAVPDKEIRSFIEDVRASGIPYFSIWQKNKEGLSEPVALRPVYYPVLYIEPPANPQGALGYDLNSDPKRSAAIQEALSAGLASASDPVQFFTATHNSLNEFFVFLPVQALTQKGLVSVTIRPELLMDTLARKNRELNVCLFQLNPGQEPYFMAGSSRQCGLPCWDDQDPGLRSTVPVFRFGKTYAFRAGPSPDWLAKHPLRNGWPACGIGLLLSLLVSALTAMLVNRQLVLERMVEHRTDELKRAEKTLAHLNRQYEMILSSMAEGILGLDLRGNHIFVNPAAAKMLGYEIEELIGRPSHSLWHHSKADGTPYPEDECKIHAASKAGKSCRASNEVFWRKDGSSFPVAYNSGPILESGQPAGAVITFDDITERRRTEASLMASKARFRDIAMNISDLIWEMDTQGVLRYVSGQSVGLLGYTAEELVGTTRFNRMHAQQAEAANAFFAERFRDHKPFRDYENWTVHKDGTPICILSSGMPMFSEAGIFIGYCGADTDITTRKGYEEDIKQSVSLLEATLDATADGILVVDGKGRILRFNRKFIEMWKIPDDIIASGSEAAVLDMVLGQLCEPEVFLAKVRALSRQPDAISFDVLNFHDGRVFERNSQPQRIAGRVGGRAWSFHDVTKREQAEALLWASQTKLDLALQSASMGVWQWDVITDTHTYDRQACAFMGINPATFGGTEAELLAVVHPADRQKIKEALTRTVEQHAPYDMEYRAICPDGMVRHIATRAQLFLDDGDRQLKVTGVCWDITDRRKAEERMHLLMEHLQTVREEERKRIARELHDDIGQILTAIKIDLSVVESGCRCQGDLKNKMGAIQQMLRTGIESIHSLCRQLRPGALDDLDLSDALEGLIDDWKKRNQVECALYADVDDEALSDGVKTAAFRVTQEALTNISRYAQASKVEVNLVADEQAFNITITDDGLGMEPGAADKPTSFGLLGMRERVEALGGTLSIESSPGKGTRIEATLPLPRNGELKTGDFG